MLSFEHKRDILNSFSELEESMMKNNRFNYALRAVPGRRRMVAREFALTGNGYVRGTAESKHPIDIRGWVNVKSLTEDDLRLAIRQAINMLQTGR